MVRAVGPRTGEPCGPEFPDVEPQALARVLSRAAGALPAMRRLTPREVSRGLDAAAAVLDAHADGLAAVADAETALGRARLTGEVARTTGQLRMFADLVESGAHLDAVIDTRLPDGAPARDLRRIGVPIGPVAVFGASNFPFAFSVAGGDTASALAAGCPVVAKAHPAHPATSQAVADLVVDALRAAGLPDGVFQLVHGAAPALAAALVTDPVVAAVAFTGSTAVGRRLHDLAAARPTPVPVYAEMGSLNPVVVAPSALGDQLEQTAGLLAGSVAQGWGQFCTRPGVVVVPASEAEAFASAVAQVLASADPAHLLTAGIRSAFEEGVGRASAAAGTRTWRGAAAPAGHAAAAAVLTVSAQRLVTDEALRTELFGPAVVVVAVDDLAEMEAVLDAVGGSLTGTVHGDPDDPWVSDAVAALVPHVGRVVVGGVPTGVAVADAIHHGGPYPASTVPWATSVGSAAVRRFLRPVAFQDVPQQLLPPGLADENPWGIERTVDGQRTPAGWRNIEERTATIRLPVGRRRA